MIKKSTKNNCNTEDKYVLVNWINDCNSQFKYIDKDFTNDKYKKKFHDK